MASNEVKLSRPDSLRDPVTCMAWEVLDAKPRKASSGKKKKTGTDLLVPSDAPPALALGTLTGRVLLLDLATAEAATLAGQHADRVNALAWHTDRQRVYSASNDKHLGEWDVVGHKLARYGSVPWTGGGISFPSPYALFFSKSEAPGWATSAR